MTNNLCVPKLTGADVEFGNFVDGSIDRGESARDASRILLAEIRRMAGVAPLVDEGDQKREDPQDHDRTFLPANGGCAYIDQDHLELCIPEVRSAFDHVAWWHAMVHMASTAQATANAERPANARIQLLANNSDGRVSYGSHLNVLMSRAAWDEVVHRKPHYLAFLAAFQVSSLPFTGQGKVGSERGAAPATFQLSQRADYFESMTGVQTTHMRPIVNTRDEPLCGRWDASRAPYARLHSIFFDSTLCHVSTLLRVGTMQLVLAMIERGQVDSRCALDDPLDAVRRWSRNPALDARVPLVDGTRITALELQRRFWEQASAFVGAGHADGIVPRAPEILAIWDDTLSRLEARDWDTLARRLDWVLKLSFLERAFQFRPSLDWTSPEIRHLDQLYSSLDHADGLYWSVADRGLVETTATPDHIATAEREPPPDTRAWGRARLQQRAGASIEQVDWDFVRVRLGDGRGASDAWRVDLVDPLHANRQDLQGVLGDNASRPDALAELLEAIGAVREPREVRRSKATASNTIGWPLVLTQWRLGGSLSPRAAWTLNNLTNADDGGNDGTT